MPPLDVRCHVVSGEKDFVLDKNGQTKMFRDVAKSLKDAAAEKNKSIEARVQKALEIVEESPKEHFILWHDLEAERHEIKRKVPGVIDIYGSMDYDEREKRTIKEMMQMRMDGATVQEIADKAGVSKQWVSDRLHRYMKRLSGHRGHGFHCEDIWYEGLYQHFSKNEKESITSFARKVCGKEPCPAFVAKMRSVLTGERETHLTVVQIKKICEVVGMSFEDVFAMRKEDEGNESCTSN